MREKISGVFDVFRDIHNLRNTEVLETVHEDKIDIAIDLTGYTKDSKTNLFSSRLAPVQINYLGYPGTLGADFMDYIVADSIVIPEDKQQHYSEQVMYLPHTYQPNDNTRAISQKVQTKENMGLPSDGFIFCCFNNNYKISPKEFDIGMRLMAKVEGSVLWLLKSNKWAEQNLKKEAEARGISADRVIFAERVENSEHLARHRLADLFLDTFNVNAHTTASDALWAGLPVVTKLGRGFAARVAGSLLSAVGLPELITHDEEAYEALILKLATQPKKLDTIKKKLEVNRLSQPLFNTEQYTKHLENGYQQAYQRYFEGKEPDTIIVPE
jgi:predicted O-linked N-acetylglucosamine transferase (SPINDLY family)